MENSRKNKNIEIFWLLCGREFCGIDLSNRELRNGALTGTCFSNSNLSGSDFSWSDLSDSYFTNTNMRFSKLEHCDLRGTNLSNADLTGAKLTDSLFNTETILPFSFEIAIKKQMKFQSIKREAS